MLPLAQESQSEAGHDPDAQTQAPLGAMACRPEVQSRVLAKHQPLPCRPLIAEVGEPEGLDHIRNGGPVLYVIDMRLEGSTYKGFVFLHHQRQFSKEELDKMTAEAAALTNDVRIATRRKQMIKSQTPMENPQMINESLFKTDMDFLETVLSDRFGFDIVRANVVTATIEPTLKAI